MQATDLTVRPARPEEAADLADLVNAAYGRTDNKPGWTSEDGLIEGPRIDEEALRALIERDESVVLVAERREESVGCVHLERAAHDASHLGLLSIDPELQAESLGRAFLSEAEGYARDHLDAERIEMHVLTVRTELLDWYERRGYERTGERHPADFGGEQRSLQGPLTFEVLEKPLA